MRVAKGAFQRNLIRFFKSAPDLQFSGVQSLVRLRTPLCAPEQPVRNRGTLQRRLSFRTALLICSTWMTNHEPWLLTKPANFVLRTPNF